MPDTRRCLLLPAVLFAATLVGGQTRGYECYSLSDDPTTLISECTSFIATHPESDALAFSYSRRGYGFYRKGEFDRAIADFNEAVRRQPAEYEGYELRAMAYDAKRDYGRAVDDAITAVLLGSWNFGALYNLLGIVYRHNGDYARSIAAFDYALHLFDIHVDDPGRQIHARWLNNRAMSKLASGDVQGADADFDEARTIDPDTHCSLSPDIVDAGTTCFAKR